MICGGGACLAPDEEGKDNGENRDHGSAGSYEWRYTSQPVSLAHRIDLKPYTKGFQAEAERTEAGSWDKLGSIGGCVCSALSGLWNP